MTSQARALALQPAKLLAVNVNGLAGKNKRRAFFKHVLSTSWDVLVLSETHCGGPDVAAKWLRGGAGPGKPWLGQAFWSHGTSASRGVAVLLRQGFAAKAKVEFADTAGRVLRVGWDSGPQGRPVSVVAVYAPADGEASRSAFFAPDGPLQQAIAAGSGSAADLFLGGDFNCRLPVGESVGAQPADVQRLQGLVAAAGLRDAWAAARGSVGFRPEEAWTFLARGPGRTSSSRLDYWFVPSQRVGEGWVARCGHRWDAAAPGDHAAVALEWRCPDATPRGKSRWIFPNFLLRDQGFVSGSKGELSAFLDGWQPNGDPQQAASPAGARWEAAKEWLKGRALHELRQRALQVAGERRQAVRAERQARVRAAIADAPAAAEAYQSWRAAAKRLQDASMSRGADDLVAGGVPLDVLWDACGEQSTGWFHRLMPREQGDAGLTGGPTAMRVQRPDGGSDTVSVHAAGGLAKVGDALSAFFDGNGGGLFAPSAVSAEDQDLLLAAVDRFVPPKEVARCRGPAGDGLVSLECLAEALKGTAPNKAPGSDGLTYEVYKAFWDVLQQPLADCFNEAFQGLGLLPEPLAQEVRLTESQRQGIIVLLHKGGDKPVDDAASYRPITLLNTDVKLLARVLVGRMAAGLDLVVDATQTAFIPGRWIGDNVLFHLEEIDYCQAEQVPACVVFLDFEKAYDRLDRGWLFRCLDRLGFPEELSRWVQLMLKDTVAAVLYHGYLCPRFAVLSGVAQGSPLSPLLYLVAAQPLAARLRQLQEAGLLDAVLLPDGSMAPPSHQHADDTTVHTKTPEGAAVALQLAVVPFGRASGARVNVAKSLGMLLGVVDSVELREQAQAVVGVPFVAPGGHTRHLGVLLSARDVEGAAKAMFAKRRAGVFLRVRNWARFDLSYLGRVHVAKQVLANTFCYHATFVAPPPDVLQQVVDCIDSFVVLGRVLELGQPPPLRHVPSAAVESLPWALGGLRRADIPAHSMALNAKVAAALLHPKRHPWKVLMRRAFQRMLPNLGAAALVSQLQPVASVGRPARLMGYWKAFHALQPHRLVAAAALPAERVLSEQLVHNAQVKGFAPQHAVVRALPAALVPVLGPCPSVAAVRRVLHASDVVLSPAVLQRVGTVRALLPEAWTSVVDAAVLPEPRWLVSSCCSWACRAPEVFSVCPDGRLGPLDDTVQPPSWAAVQWCPAAVVWCPVGKGQELLVAIEPDPHLGQVPALATPAGETCKLQAWLQPAVGHGQVLVDPNVWGIGRLPVSSFVVSAATDRLKVLGMARLQEGFVPCEGVRPGLFSVAGQPGVGLAAVETGQVQAYTVRWQALEAGHQVQPRSVRQRVPEDERGCCPLYEAAWMRASVARVHPCERAAHRLGLVAGGQAQARVDDGVDAVAGYDQTRQHAWAGEGKAPWLVAFAVVRLERLARPLRFFGWLLTHGALRCGGAMVTWRRAEEGFAVGDFVEMCACGAEECLAGERPAGDPPPCETLSHVFLHCPVVKPAVEWLRGLWARLGDGPPPLDAQVLVVGDQSVWSPGGGDVWELWTHLRLEFCHAVWRLTTRRASTGQVFAAAAVVEMAAAALERSICLDWARVGAGQGNSVEDKRVRLESEDFDARWLRRGVLADRDNGTLQVHVPRSLQPAT